MTRITVKQVVVRVWEIRPGWQDLLVFGVILGAAWWLTGIPPLPLVAGAAGGIAVASALIAVKELRGEDASDPPEDGDDADL